MKEISAKLERVTLKSFSYLFFSIALITLSNFVFVFVEKLLLARFSTDAMGASVGVAYVCQIFQIPCTALVAMAQVYVGKCRGANQNELIGPAIWQFIWFSLLSMLITVPCSIVYGKLYFQGTPLEEVVFPYFYFLISINFLYPLGLTLSFFYIGQGKTRFILFSTIGSQLIKLGLAFLLIFGWKDSIPPMGLMGGAISTIIAQGSFCLLLLIGFLNLSNSTIFNSRQWNIQPKLFWECVKPGLVRAGARILSFSAWASIAHMMTARGGEYLIILSIGGILFFILPFISDALCQTQVTVVSQSLGAGNREDISQAYRSGSILTLIIVTVIGIPLLLFPSSICSLLFPTIVVSSFSIQKVFIGIWISFAFSTWSYIPVAYIIAFKDVNFLLLIGALNWVNGYLLIYVALNFFQIAPDDFWLVLSLMHGSFAALYYFRMKVLQSKFAFSNLQLQPQT